MSAATRRADAASADAADAPRGAAPLAAGPSVRYAAVFSAVLLLIVSGVVLVLSATSATGVDAPGRPRQYFNRHLWSAGAAMAALVVTLGVSYRRWQRRGWVIGLAAASAASSVVVLMAGTVRNGARRWLDFGVASFQPSELAKLALIVTLAAFIDARKTQLERRDRMLRPAVLMLGLVCGLVLVQPDLGTALILAAIGAGMLFAAGLPLRDLSKIALVVGCVAAVFTLGSQYRRDRWTGFLNPVAERSDEGYQVFQGIAALAQGGLHGSGLGTGQAKWGWVPNTPTDFIFVVAGEELGFLGAIAILALLCVVCVGGLRTAQKAPDMFGTLLAAGISTWFVTQTMVNVGGVVGLMPVTGVPLPFLSFGGSSLVVSAAAAGLLLNVTRRSG